MMMTDVRKPTSALVVVLMSASVSASPAGAQQGLPLLSVDVELRHYGIETVGAITRGRVSVVYAPEGPRLSMYYLRDTPPPPRNTRTDPAPPAPDSAGGDAPAGRELERALWVWNSRELLDDASARLAFLDFVERQGITRLFLYLPAARGMRPDAGFIPFDGEEIGPFLAEVRARGALTYALDGDRDYVRPENHAGVYRTIERLVEHNRRAPPRERFHGIRYDIEPYLAPGFQGPARAELLDGYVELIAGVARRAREGGLSVAVDVPFWLDAPDEETGEQLQAVLAGRRRTVLEHVMSLVDDIAIMDYRTRADGPNGALTHARGELALGEKAGVGVFVGVETTRLLDEDLHTFFGPASAGLPGRADARWIVVEELGADGARVWLVDGEEQLRELARRTSDRERLRHWPAGRPARVAADAQSFHALGPEAMDRVTTEIVRGLERSPAFLGLAFHDYLGLRELLERR